MTVSNGGCFHSDNFFMTTPLLKKSQTVRFSCMNKTVFLLEFGTSPGVKRFMPSNTVVI